MKLYNNIDFKQPEAGNDLRDTQPPRIPWLSNPPEVINVDIGRQLFIDDFLIDQEKSRVSRRFHYPAKYPCNPIFFPQTKLELNYPNHAPCAACKCGGVQFDSSDNLFKMWYMASYCGTLCYAESSDGIHWERPKLDVVKGTNICLPKTIKPDSGSVIIDDHCTNPDERFKMLMREINGEFDMPGQLYTSPDGKHWKHVGTTGNMQDRSTMYYNPFTRKWVQSIRWGDLNAKRCRYYYEHDDFVQSGRFDWEQKSPIPWMRADEMDKGVELLPQLYNFDAMPYESLMLGFFQIFKGPNNNISEQESMPKRTELNLAYSRDGFNFHRPDRTAFIEADRRPGSWEYGYVESSAGCCQQVGDELWFYYSAYAGDRHRHTEPWWDSGVYANGAVGLAKLRLDGFASIDFRMSDAKLVTNLLEFSGNSLRVNANTAGAMLKVEVLDNQNQTIPGFGMDDCVGFIGNSTSAKISWRDASLAQLSGQAVKFCFAMPRGELYSFDIQA